MLTHQGGGMLAPCHERRHHLRTRGALPRATARLRSHRSQPMRRIGLPANFFQELALAPSKERSEHRSIQPVARREFGQIDAPREAVPRADELAIVAAIDAVADRRTQDFGNRPGMLDGQIRDTAARVQTIGSYDRPGRTEIEAARAASAVRRNRFVDRQGPIGEDLAEKEERPFLAVQQERVLAAPAQACALGERHFHHRRRIDEDPSPMRPIASMNATSRAKRARTALW